MRIVVSHQDDPELLEQELKEKLRLIGLSGRIEVKRDSSRIILVDTEEPGREPLWPGFFYDLAREIEEDYEWVNKCRVEV